MQTSLQGIAAKSALHKEHRFQNLTKILTVLFLTWCWKFLNKKSAPGIDRVSARQFKENFRENVKELAESIRVGWYRARLILRRFIPKPGGKLRPLGLPVIRDKLVQTAVAKILEAIYEPIFLACSFGYRPMIGALDAVKNLSTRLQFGGFHYIVEADIKSFFDSINHEILLEMLTKKIDDKPFLRLIRKWLKAGVLIDNQVMNPVTGTPQGGIVSPILANIYLHYVLDVWFEEIVKTHIRGRAYHCRYADDFVCAFQYQDDAERFFKSLKNRLEKFGLSLAEEKTRIIRFSRLHKEDKTSFEFLGFEFRWGTDRKGRPQIRKRTSRKKFRDSLKRFTEWCRLHRNMRMTDLINLLNQKLRGYYQYYGVIGNFRSLSSFFWKATNILYKWMNRRSQRRSFTWKGFVELLKHFRIERPRITERRTQKQYSLFQGMQNV